MADRASEPVVRRNGGVLGLGGREALLGARRLALAWPVLLTGIAVLALGLRLYSLDWDEGHHLHPDERFISFVGTGTGWPSSVGEYFDTQRSPLNPNRDASYSYGTFPLFLTKAVAEALGKTTFEQQYLVGRTLTALFDVGTVLLIFAIGSLLWSRRVGLLAALLLALTVLHIQLAHFWTVDPYLTFFSAATLYFSIQIARRGGAVDYLLCGAAIGLGLASKVTALTLLALPVGAVVLRLFAPAAAGGEPRRSPRPRTLLGLAGSGAAAFAVFRLAQPYAFAGPNFWDIGLDAKFLAVVREQQQLTSGAVGSPPFVQWAHRTAYAFPLENMLLWGLGLPLGLAALAGFGYGAYRLLRLGDGRPALPLLLVVGVFDVYGGRFVTYARYFEPAYPALVLLAAVLLVSVWTAGKSFPAHNRVQRLGRLILLGAAPAVIVLTGAWALAFLHIYSAPLTRIEASRWIYDHVPARARIAQETWDDGLPLNLGEGAPAYRFVVLDPYGTDTPEKVERYVRRLARSDYVVLSSDRARKSIPRIPEQYPATSRYYRALDDGSLGFALVAKFESPPTLLGLRIPDGWAEESLSVYDHPIVRIYRRTPRYSEDRARALLMAAHPERAVTLTPRGGDYHGLLLTPSNARAQQAGGSWKQLFGTKTGVGRFEPETIVRAYPALTWLIVLELLSLAAMPLLLLLLRNLPDRGYPLAKPLGLLLLAFPVWLGVSLGLFSFSRAAVLACAGALFLAGAATAVWHRAEVGAFFRRAWPYVLVTEVVFLAAFLAFYALRLANPDLWHPERGGEKPMDFAYLNAVVKSTELPPYDPWFAGGHLNYYYFGQFLTATLIKPLGIAPEVAYNLAVPMFAALVAAATFSLASNLVAAVSGGRRPAPVARPGPTLAGIFGVVLVLGVGNLDAARQWSHRLQRVDTWHLAQDTWFPGRFLGTIGGLWNWLVHGASLAPFDWWGSSRLIPGSPAITEFPFFTFFFADLHAHLTALAFAIVAATLALALVLAGAERASLPRRAALLVVLGLVVGSLRATNTWDLPTQAGLAALAAIGCVWLVHRRITWTSVRAAVGHVALFLGAAWLLFLPFSSSFEQFAGSIERSPGTTPPQSYLLHFGVFLALAAGFAGTRLARIAGRPGRRAAALGLAVMVAAVGAVVAATALTGYGTVVMLALAAAFLIALAALDARRGAAPALLAAYSLIVVALLISLGVELFRVHNDIERQNTVFKFYLQAWWLLAVAGAVAAWAVVDLVRHLRAERRLGRLAGGLAAGWGTAVALLVAAAALYPASAIPPREADRFHATSWTADGTAYMPAARFHDDHGNYDLGRDYRAILWAREHIPGSPVILEGVTPLYRWGNRFAVYTGLPAVIGWDFHQTQQRLAYQDQVAQRREDVDTFYNTSGRREALEILDRYGVRYVFVGELERRYYGARGLAKIPRLGGLTRVYDRARVQIYRVDQGAVERALA